MTRYSFRPAWAQLGALVAATLKVKPSTVRWCWPETCKPSSGQDTKGREQGKVCPSRFSLVANCELRQRWKRWTSRIKPIYHTSNLNRPGMAWRRRSGKGNRSSHAISLTTSCHSTEMVKQPPQIVMALSSRFYGDLVPMGRSRREINRQSRTKQIRTTRIVWHRETGKHMENEQ